jgi:nicotinamidase-related amidase
VPVELGALLAGATRSDDADPRRLAATVVTSELQRGVVGDLAALPELAAAAEAARVIPNAARLCAAARAASVPVVHCTVAFRSDRAGTALNTPLHAALLRRGDHLLAGSPAAELVPGLGAEESDVSSVRAHGVSPFTGTSLDATLRALGTRVVICAGVSLNVAIVGMCIEAVNLGYETVVVTDAVAGVPLAFGDAVLKTTLRFIATLATVDQLIAAMDRGA